MQSAARIYYCLEQNINFLESLSYLFRT